VVCIPAAFVAFAKEGVEGLGSRRKARVVAAGPWHNLVGWCFWLCVGWVLGNWGVGGVMLRMVGYRDVSGVGRVVVGVDEVSFRNVRLGFLIQVRIGFAFGWVFDTWDGCDEIK
jgi:S2P endopeptidase